MAEKEPGRFHFGSIVVEPSRLVSHQLATPRVRPSVTLNGAFQARRMLQILQIVSKINSSLKNRVVFQCPLHAATLQPPRYAINALALRGSETRHRDSRSGINPGH